jgi:hypothetical protein
MVSKNWPRSLLEVGALVCLVFLVSAPAWQAGFHSDDFEYLDRSFEPSKIFLANKEGVRGVGGRYRPLTISSILLDRAWSGLNPTGYNITNKVLHLACAVEVLWLVNLLFPGRRQRAFLAAALFAVHPIFTDTVFWISARPDSLCGVFYFLALILYVRAACAPVGSRRLVVSIPSLAMFALALMSKEMAVTLPAMIVICDLVCVESHGSLSRRERATRAAWSTAPYAAVLSIYLLGRQVCLGSVAGGTDNMHFTVPGVLRNLATAWYAMTFPWSHYDLVLFAALAAGLAFPVSRRAIIRREVGFGIAWSFVALVPVLGLITRWYMYLPAVGVCLAAATILTPDASPAVARRGLLAVAAALILANVALLRHEARLWVESGRVAASILDDLHRQTRAETPTYVLMVPAGIVADEGLGLGEKPVFAYNLEKAVRIVYGSTASIQPIATVFLRNSAEGGGTVEKLDDHRLRITLDDRRARFSYHSERVPLGSAPTAGSVLPQRGYRVSVGTNTNVMDLVFDAPLESLQVLAYSNGHIGP